MKKTICTLLISTMITLPFMNCYAQTESSAESTKTAVSDNSQSSDLPVVIKDSPDKYTWYIKNYVGKNCASFGYTSMGGNRMDSYGSGLLELVFITPDGSYLDLDEDTLKQYVVTAQNIVPNTELKLTFQKDSDGNEYDNLVDTQTYEEIVLSIKKVNTQNSNNISLTEINPSPDKYTRYISDYTGRNLASCGYVSLGGNLMARYGAAVITLVVVPDDGSFVDPKDEETLKNYVVTGQNVSPNTELKLEFETDSNGKEYDNLIALQNIEEIELNVKPCQ